MVDEEEEEEWPEDRDLRETRRCQRSLIDILCGCGLGVFVTSSSWLLVVIGLLCPLSRHGLLVVEVC